MVALRFKLVCSAVAQCAFALLTLGLSTSNFVVESALFRRSRGIALSRSLSEQKLFLEEEINEAKVRLRKAMEEKNQLNAMEYIYIPRIRHCVAQKKVEELE